MFILITSSLISSAQVFDSSQNPPSIQWKEITTVNFEIVYPSSFENEAQRMANTLNSIIGRVSLSYHIKPRKVTVILQNQGTSANGFVQLAPRRSEFFTTPPQNFDYQDWLNSLAVHEMRHVVQFDKLTGYLKKPFFEELALAMFGIILPPWFYEGDAVGTETALTNAGRGRIPEWDLILRTNTLSRKNFSYSKDYFGSVKNTTPGYYQLGFYMVTKLRRDQGPGILDSLMKRMSKLPVRPYNLSSSVKKFTGYNTAKLHDSTVNELRQKWRDQQALAGVKDYTPFNRRKSDKPVNYYMPAAVSPTQTIVLKTGKTSIPEFVEIDSSGKEAVILKIGIQEEPYFNYAAGNLVWDEFRFDKRFQKRSFNVINIYNLKTKSYKQLTHRSRLFSPALSADARQLVAVEVSYNNQVSLVELNILNGKETVRYHAPDNTMLQNPQFNWDASKIIMTGISKSGATLLELDRATKTFNQLFPFQLQLISHPVYAGHDIIFKAHFNGIDNLYRFNRATQKTEQLTSVQFGAFNPYYDSQTDRILFNNYQFDGFDIAAFRINNSQLIPLESVRNNSVNYIDPVVKQEGGHNVFDSIPSKQYDTKIYSAWKHLFYFHSLYPVIEKNEFYDDYNLGLKIQSDNKLNTLSVYAGYQFNQALRKSEYFGGLTYSRIYPVFNLQYLNQARLIYQQRSSKLPSVPVSWRENQLEATVTIPFLFNQLNYNYSAALETGTTYTLRYQIINRPGSFIDILNFPIYYRGYFSRNSMTSPRDLSPLWGQNISLTYRHFPFENRIKGKLLSFQSTFYFPGLKLHHSLVASFNYQNSAGVYESTIDIPKVSGYNNLRYSGAVKNTLLLDYLFPVFYPDWEIGPLAYIKRFKGSLFSDFENIGRNNRFSPRTYGLGLSADMNLLRFYLPDFEVGTKLIFVNEKPHQNPIFELNIGYSF